MAINTPKSYRNQVMYSVYVRNHTPEGTFQALRRDLSRIKSLGTDIIWLMPIHPIGKVARKGSLGSPYAISDYRAVNPEYGTLEDFKALVDDIHALGMKCIIDVVYNHTSPDSWLVNNHPEWFYHKPDGSFGNHVGDWTDIVDLDYEQKELWDYQIETLKMWAEIVDGFRCDVAPLLPMAFWQKAREEVEKVRPGCFWLSESVEPGFIQYLRSQGLVAHTDSEVLEVFDASQNGISIVKQIIRWGSFSSSYEFVNVRYKQIFPIIGSRSSLQIVRITAFYVGSPNIHTFAFSRCVLAQYSCLIFYLSFDGLLPQLFAQWQAGVDLVGKSLLLYGIAGKWQ